jgi:hypothetical protein
MSILGILYWWQETPFGTAFRKLNYIVDATFQLVHIIGFVLLLAAVTLINLRLFGLALMRQAPARIISAGNILLGIGLAAAVLSGTLIFLTGPVRYYNNEFFELKMLLLIATVLFQASLFRAVSRRAAENPLAGKAVAIVSLLLWFCVGISGRAIGFI